MMPTNGETPPCRAVSAAPTAVSLTAKASCSNDAVQATDNPASTWASALPNSVRNPVGIITTTFVISNLHCSSCSTTVRLLLAPLSPPPHAVSTNILTHEVTVGHSPELNPNEILRVLLEAEFEVDSVNVTGPGVNTSAGNSRLCEYTPPEAPCYYSPHRELPLEDWGERVRKALESGKRSKKHMQVCELCQKNYLAQHPGLRLGRPNACTDETAATIEPGWRSKEGPGTNESDIGVAGSKHIINTDGAPCSTSEASTSESSPYKQVSTPNISPAIGPAIGSEPAMSYNQSSRVSQMDERNENQYELHGGNTVDMAPPTALFEATFSIEGMTCSACTSKVKDTIRHFPGVKNVEVALMTNSATVTFEGLRDDAAKVVDEIEDIGYGCVLESTRELNAGNDQARVVERVVQIRVDGMFCKTCPIQVLKALEIFEGTVTIERPLTFSDPIVQISYLPSPPDFTIRQIISRLNSLHPSFSASIYHPPTIEERSRHIQRTELRRLMIRAAACIIIAIPTFMIGVVWMSLVPVDDRIRLLFEEPAWAGQVSRSEWSLFLLSTPVQFFIADVFHVRAFKEIRALWRPGSQVPILRRFYRFGSMNLLISLGVSIAYFSSVGLLIAAALRVSGGNGHRTTYFDSTVFLTMFLLIGRCLEAYSKIKTSDAVSMLGKLRPTEALLVSSDRAPPASINDSISDAARKGTHAPSAVKKVSVDMLEAGDTIVVQHGGSPPADGKILEGETKFDESSLTGEARPVQKKEGDMVFSGTINKGKAVKVVVDAMNGESMLDQIVKVVREGQTRKAPIERVADIITGYFVPVVTLIAILTWIIWLSLGEAGVLPSYWLDTDDGSWPVWSLGFAIAVFVVACPCGIGLAAPTALFVGSGLAAKHGILAKGGGEAFQEASWLDVIVFDKTGTLTEGGEPKVTAEAIFTASSEAVNIKLAYALAMGLEEMSSHPLARAVISYCEMKERSNVIGSEVEEVPGRGLRGVFTVASKESNECYEAIIGNEAFMMENSVTGLDEMAQTLLHSWKNTGKSVILLAIKLRSGICLSQETYTLTTAFAVTDSLRPEASHVVKSLSASGISVWMISGDNPVTATAVAGMIGIPRENVIAGVLPTEKAEKIKWLQENAPRRTRFNWFGKNTTNKRPIVAMVGDGINDAPALAISDVGVAIGSGSDIAIGSAKFILVSSNLYSLLTLIELSQAVLRRVKFNFFWASVYNLIALPVAAGVLYPVGMIEYRPPSPLLMESGMYGKGPQRIRLEPVWASLAMALSSVSVVCSSLLLRTKVWGVGFRAKKHEEVEIFRTRSTRLVKQRRELAGGEV